MPMPEITFHHVYLLMDCHQSPPRMAALSASRLKSGFDLVRLGLLEELDGRWHPSDKAIEKINAFGTSLKEVA